ncbi:cation-translocating P-type ATPase [Yoonia sediminilitoris]|uniref:Ca2+-transporting ATPase n=1 Tax=Yoonia sediminilitoris TaxID=1286148 RepID=A0A2T6KIT3_9RHOB|nr:cation-transporting P-type ATPase [Yoonia sediminilitoris]PUB15632.1 Ca2+-transporting ATPase [Yoonia sediminilitoris]RCW96241.1 Ca2+-transporting ATPase [Yoonia sediminilitoris]
MNDDQTVGLTSQQVSALHKSHGWNELPQTAGPSALRILLRQFTNVLVVILVIAAAIAFVAGERIDTIAIGVVIFLNGALGFVQEWRAENALHALRNMLSPQATVLRNGRQLQIPARDLVPGDIILVATGDRVPADAALIEQTALSADESALTGESVPVSKDSDDATILMGTNIVEGRGMARVTDIGTQTQFGEIALLTGSVIPRQTHMQQQLGQLARQLGAAALMIGAGVMLLGLLYGRPATEMFMTAISLAVAMVPEGLPAVVTITIALGAAALVRQHALTRRLQAIEALGAASVICTDKTGTLTENKMTATRIWTPQEQYQITGTGYDPAGYIAAGQAKRRASNDPLLAQLLAVCAGCNNATLQHDRTGWTMIGSPTEGALITLAYKGWAPLPDPENILDERPFNSDRKRMSVLRQTADGPQVFTKGAPEKLRDLCSEILGPDGPVPLTDAGRAEIDAAYTALAENGHRVIALATAPAPDGILREEGLVFLGLVGIIDPPRPEIPDAVAQAHSAGARIIMITGDSPVTAKAIAQSVGLQPDWVITHDALAAMSDADLADGLAQDMLIARAQPADKMRIVSLLQKQGQIVAMTGDGVNDAPALEQADIGIAMGIRGTDVAKDAADLVLLDDNFATIIAAMREGRRQFDNLRKFVRYLLSSNAGEVVAILCNILIGGPLIFLATQILWMNLITDGLTAVALGLEKPEPGQMKDPPRKINAPVLGWSGFAMIAVFGVYTGLCSLWIFWQLLPVDETLARTAAFTAMVAFEKFSVFAFRSLRSPCWKIGLLSNPFLLLALVVTLGAQVAAVYWPPLQSLLHTTALGWAEWQMIGLFCLPLILLPELIKTIRITGDSNGT